MAVLVLQESKHIFTKVVQKYIIDVCLELMENYNIDAIHFDDYFYLYRDIGNADISCLWQIAVRVYLDILLYILDYFINIIYNM